MVTPTPTSPPQMKKGEGGRRGGRGERGGKDMSLSTNAIREERKRKIVEMKMQVMQTLTEATLLRLGGEHKAIFQLNKGLIHVLKLVSQAPGGKISTRELLRSIKSTSMHKHLKESELLGFIKRETERMPKGQKGGTMVVNSLTEEGRILLKMANEFDNDNDNDDSNISSKDD